VKQEPKKLIAKLEKEDAKLDKKDEKSKKDKKPKNEE